MRKLPRFKSKSNPEIAVALNLLAEEIEKSQPNIAFGQGIEGFTDDDGNLTFSSKGKNRSAGGKAPWKVTTSFVDGDLKASVYPATMSNLVPTNIFDTIAISETGTYYIVATGSSDGRAVQSVVLSAESSAPISNIPEADAAPATVYDLIAIIHDNKVFQIRSSNTVAISYEALRESRTASAGELPYTPWYAWRID
jgi:hypothetical protein